MASLLSKFHITSKKNIVVLLHYFSTNATGSKQLFVYFYSLNNEN